MASMIIKWKNEKEYHSCPGCRWDIEYKNDELPNNDVIPIFYSEVQAHDAGWRKTIDPIFCEPKYNGSPVWVCPECWEGATHD